MMTEAEIEQRTREFLCHLKGWSKPWHLLTQDQRDEIDDLVAKSEAKPMKDEDDG